MNSEEFMASEEQRHIELLWSSRNVFTVADRDWLSEMKVEYGDPCGLELNGRKALDRCQPKGRSFTVTF